MLQISLTNTMTGKKQQFSSQNDQIGLYVCGITPYDYAHVGHGRCYVTFDLLYRLLGAAGYQVTYCRNFTDIDDKLLNRAQAELGDRARYAEIAARYINAYHEDIAQLGCKAPTYEPLVTDHMQEIINFVQGLIEKGYAYTRGGDVYYRVRSFAQYGKLSHRNIEELQSGARVAIDQEKEDPLDFALWKAEEPNTFWKSPWGWGRPGWHIECSAMAYRYLGKTVDIHGGGMDLIFPHHENEIAQSEALLGQEFARFWVHNAFVRINKEKMSKSLGNFFTLRDIFARFDPMAVRYYFITHHYRSPLDFAWDDLESAQKSYQRLCKALQGVSSLALPVLRSFSEAGSEHQIVRRMMDFLCDDLNTPGMLGVVFEHLSEITQHPQLAAAVKYILKELVGLTLVPLPEKTVEITPEIQQLIDERVAARAAKNWKRSDELRDQLKALGIEVQDKKS